MKKKSKYEKISFALGLSISIILSVYLIVSGKLPITVILVLNALIYIGSYLWTKFKGNNQSEKDRV